MRSVLLRKIIIIFSFFKNLESTKADTLFL